MNRRIKNLLIKVLLPVLNCFGNGGTLKKFRQKVYMADLYRKNPVEWRYHRAIEMGVKIGKNCRLYSLGFFSEPYLVKIGDNVIVSGDVKFLTHDGSFYLFKSRDEGGVYGKISIGHNCFIGMNSLICPNTQIGDNCIIGAGTVVRGVIPDNSVVIGNPCKIVYKTSIVKKFLLASPGRINHSWGDEEARKKTILKHFGS